MLALTASAQREFSLEDLNFGGNNYRNMIPQNRTLRWWGDQLVRLENDSCWTVDLKTGGEKLLFTRANLNRWAALSDSVASLRNVWFPYADQPLAMAYTGTDRVLIDFKKHRLQWSQSFEGKAQATSWDKGSRTLAAVIDDNLWLIDSQGNRSQITTDGSRDIVYAQSVHRNEWGIDDGMFWSPDGQRLAFYRMDQSMVADYPLVDVPELNDTTRVIALPAPEKYPMAGCTSHLVTVGVVNIATGDTLYLQAGDPTDRYFTNVAWSPDSRLVYMFELNRDQNDCRLVSYDATTGHRVAELYRETDDRYVEPQHPIQFLPWDATHFVMQSRRDGYNHLYLMDLSGNITSQLTTGQWEVMEVVGFDEQQHNIIIAANAEQPVQRNIYKVNVDTRALTRIDEGGRGYHYASLSSTGRGLVDFYQEPDVPRNIALVDTRRNSAVRYFTAPDPWAGYTVPQFISGSIKADDGVTDLYYRMVRPADFDPSKQYPTVVYVYGGPHAHNVDASWHWASRSWETYMAQRGYVLFILDNRGSENRGRDFEQATFRQLGQVEMRDQMRGVDFLRSQAYVDTTRLGVHGWSFGGFMTISLMTNYPDVFKVGVAGGPVIDWKWYEVMYGERYMDTPQTNPEGYERTSLISKAKDLKGRLQIIIGLNDPTVVPQHAYSFLKACIAAGTQPDFYVYPGQGHNMRGHQSVHLHERITRYFDDYLKP